MSSSGAAPATQPSERPSIFAWLPAELILHVLSDDALACRDRASISLACRAFYHANNSLLYVQDIQRHNASCLFWAAKHGSIATLQQAVAHGASLNTQGWLAEHDLDDHDNYNTDANVASGDHDATGITTPLHVAAKYGRRDAAEWLLDHGADVDAASYKFCDALVVYWRQYFTSAWRPGWTPLFAALNHGHAATAELLVSRRAELTNMHTRRRRLFIPALHVAAANGVTSVMEMLACAADFDVDSRDFNGNTALHYASQCWPRRQDGEPTASTIALLLRMGADLEAVNNRLQNPLVHACWNGNFGAATLLVQAGANPRTECYVREVQKLVRPLYLATLSRADVARQAGGEPRQDDGAWEAARAGLFGALAAAGVGVDERLSYSRSFDVPMLERVCLDGNRAAASVLLDVAGAAVDSTDGKGQTALLGYLRHAGPRGRRLSQDGILSLLLARGARLDAPDCDGGDALRLAVDWALADDGADGPLVTLLRLAGARNVSEARVDGAIAACCSARGVVQQQQQQAREMRVADLLLDFRQVTWGRGRLL